MPNILEERQELMDKIDKFIFGDVEAMAYGFKWRWYNYLFLIFKILTPVFVIILFAYKQYLSAFALLIAFAFDVWLFFFNYKRVIHFVEYKELENKAKKPKGRWGS